MTVMNLRASILDMAVDDFIGLWEILWRTRSLVPEGREEEVRLTATDQTRDLLEQGLVALFRGTRFAGDEVPLSRDEALAVLSDADQWEPPPQGDATHVRLAATREGEKAYQQSFHDRN